MDLLGRIEVNNFVIARRFISHIHYLFSRTWITCLGIHWPEAYYEPSRAQKSMVYFSLSHLYDALPNHLRHRP
jgi:hypothetical protein